MVTVNDITNFDDKMRDNPQLPPAYQSLEEEGKNQIDMEMSQIEEEQDEKRNHQSIEESELDEQNNKDFKGSKVEENSINYDSKIIPQENKKNNNEEEPQLKIIKKLLSTEERKVYEDILRKDMKNANEGENGLFVAIPRMVRIKGFEINKKITVKINVVNKSKWSERVIIIPPEDKQIFKIKYIKRAAIPPGLSEVIFLTFSPEDYKEYRDNILINCPCSKIKIPIYAYPRMNIHMNEYIPKMIDLGNVTSDTKGTKNFKISNITDIDYSFKIVPIKPYPEIKIIPMEGKFLGNKSLEINISFHPKKFGIYRGEYKFELSEKCFIPYVFTVYGTCHNYTSVLYHDEFFNKDEAEKKIVTGENNINKLKQSKNNDVIDAEPKTTNDNNNNNNDSKIQIEENQEEEKNAELNIQNNNNNEDKNLNEEEKQKIDDSLLLNKTPRPASKMLSKFKDFPSNLEREFLKYYNDADSVIQAKEFKYLQFIGKMPLTEEEIKNILDFREDRTNKKINTQIQNDRDFHTTEVDKNLPEVDRDIKFYLKPNFNTNQNDNFFKTKHYFNLFLKGITKHIIRKRADDVLDKLKNMFEKNNIKTKEDFKKYCDKDWIEYYSKDQQAGDDESFNFLKMKFNQPQYLYRENVYLTNDISLNSLKQQIAHDNDINLNQYYEYTPFERTDIEIINYKPFTSPGLTQFDINLGEKELRPSCESENLIRLERGDSELATNKNEDFYTLNQCYTKHLYTKPEDLIFSNPELKKFSNFNNSNLFTESDTVFNLQPRTLNDNYFPISNYQNDFYKFYNVSYTDNDNIKIKAIDNETILYSSSMDNCNTIDNYKKMKGPNQKDLNIKFRENVDEDNYIFELEKDDDKLIIDNYEKDDEITQKIRDLNKDEAVDVKKLEKINMENKMIQHKNKWMSTVPTVMEFYNGGIVDPNKKFIL